MHLILASQSPRRRQLLSDLGLPLSFVDITTDETIDEATPIHLMAETIARRKASAYDSTLLDTDQTLITADTIVVSDNQKMGKPHDRDEALMMLRHLSGKSHTVYTGVCLKQHDRTTSFTEATQVHFRRLDDKEIAYYIDHYAPYDKAGAYGIQEWIGMIGIESIDGDYYNVMGLPLCHLYKVLKEWGAPIE